MINIREIATLGISKNPVYSSRLGIWKAVSSYKEIIISTVQFTLKKIINFG